MDTLPRTLLIGGVAFALGLGLMLRMADFGAATDAPGGDGDETASDGEETPWIPPHCRSVDVYRSLVLHKQDAEYTVSSVELPDGSFVDVEAKGIPSTNTDFWDRFSIDNTLRRIAETDPILENVVDLGIVTPGTEDYETRIDVAVTSMKDTFLATQATSGPVFFPETDGMSMLNGTSGVDLATLQPVSIFNRIDTIDALGTTCGEHRIVYSSGTTKLVIFEASIKNPHPEHGRAGCIPVLKHWIEADELDADDGSLADHVEQLFYEGVGDVPSAIHFDHFSETGQVRGNAILGWSGGDWSLREWKVATAENPDAFPVFTTQSVKDNAHAEFLTTEPGDGAVASNMSDTDYDNLRDDFLDHWPEVVAHLTAPESASLSATANNGIDFVHGFRGGLDDVYNEYQSVSQGINGSPSDTAAHDFRTGEESEALVDATPATAGLTTDHVLNRYTWGVTCAGCHQTPSARADRMISADLAFPPSFVSGQGGSFVHAAGNGSLSPALHGTFLPFRKSFGEDMYDTDWLPGDFNHDCMVTVADLLAFLIDFGNPGEGDLTCTGNTTVTDLLEMLGTFGQNCEDAGVGTPPDTDSVGNPITIPRSSLGADIDRLASDIASATSTSSTRGSVTALAEDLNDKRDEARELEDSIVGPDGLPRRIH